MSMFRRLFFLTLLSLSACVRSPQTVSEPMDALPLTRMESLSWTETVLPPSPSDTAGNLGLAGVYAGLVDGRLVVAGGANFPQGLPASGGPKVWYSDVYVQDGDGNWTCWPGALGKERPAL